MGIDPSLQYMAVAAEHKAALLPLAPALDKQEQEIRLIKRQLDRSRRANKPNKFHEDGTINRQNKEKWVNRPIILRNNSNSKIFIAGNENGEKPAMNKAIASIMNLI